ncbi:MAG: aconitase X catalytic domain-containing protein [Alicyclobacillus sp.]|nr:aconitase X catalytic domain-containing protein [Alicyclobacillus sp.]
MILDPEEQRMLDGEYGEGTALAMRVQVGIGEAFRAPRMVKISRAHVALSNQEADVWFAEKLANLGAVCRVPPTVNPGYDVAYFSQVVQLQDADIEQMQRTYAAYRKLGAVLNFSCTPYLFDNIPRRNEVVAFSESSATPYVNSVYGARTNRESAQSALCAAITGRVPEYGLLLDENRRGEVLVQVRAKIKDDFDYQLLGYAVPKKIGHRLPVFEGLPADVSPEALMNLCAELNTAGAVPMFHIVGVTPEAPTLKDAFGGRDPLAVVTITDDDLAEVHEQISERAGKIDFVLLGCPHLSLDQVRKIAHMLEGKTLKAELWINTSAHTREMLDRMGLLEVIEKAGGHVLKDSCIDQPVWHHLEDKLGATESPKCAYYTKRRKMRFVVRSIEACVRAAIEGVIV